MDSISFRTLHADEVECRVGRVKRDGTAVSILLYKDSRCDMRLLDETVGPQNWQRRHYDCKGTLFCSVGINCGDSWIWKDDAGSESNVEKEKGEASDSFKRACTNWGIGRELYTAPDIWVNLREKEDSKFISLHVREIGYNENREIDKLVIVDSKGNERYRLGAKQEKVERSLEDLAASKGIKIKTEAPEAPILCRECGDPIKAGKRNGKVYTVREVAEETGGLCIGCFEEAKANAAG